MKNAEAKMLDFAEYRVIRKLTSLVDNDLEGWLQDFENCVEFEILTENYNYRILLFTRWHSKIFRNYLNRYGRP